MDIEEVAHSDPDAIITVPVNISTGPTEEQLTDLAKKLGFSDALVPQVRLFLSSLY